MFLLAALTLGFLGSFHCIGMCGPIALAIPLNRESSWNVFSGTLVYNMGRVSTYAMLGLIFGMIGKGIALTGFQNVLSISMGILILLLLFLPAIVKFPGKLGKITGSLGKIKRNIQKQFGVHTIQSLLFIGLLNGLLPCGLVYLGIAGSLATGDAFSGLCFMAAFGLGTLPAMMVVSLIKGRINTLFREKIRKVVPVFVCFMAVLLILRGMNLGIPYVSPSTENSSGMSHHQCCQPAKIKCFSSHQ